MSLAPNLPARRPPLNRRAGLLLATALCLAVGACMANSAHPEIRGRMVDIGGRRLRMVCEGPAGVGPTVVFEAGAFGTSADWAAVQEKVSPRMRTCAYDRAGLGLSDPGLDPRDSEAIVSDLHKGLAAVGEKPPYILAAHSMGPTHAYLFAGRYPNEVVGMVLVDGISPHSPIDPRMAQFLKQFTKFANMGPVAARVGILAALKHTRMADPIGLTGLADKEKRNAFGSPKHHYWAAREVALWPRDIEEAKASPEPSPDIPIGVVTAGPGTPERRAARAAPALRSKHGYVEHVTEAAHASVLGPRFNDAVVRAIDHVRAVAQQR